MQTQCPVNAGAWKASHFLNFSGGDLDVTTVKSHAVSTFSSAVGNQTSTARATGGNLKREKGNIQMGPRSVNNRAAQDGCSSPLHVICSWWSSRAWAICHVPRPSGIAQPCHLAFQCLSPSLVLHTFSLLTFTSGFCFSSTISILSTEQSEVMLNGNGCRGFPHRDSAVWPDSCKAVLLFFGGRGGGRWRQAFCCVFFFLGKHMVSPSVEFANCEFYPELWIHPENVSCYFHPSQHCCHGSVPVHTWQIEGTSHFQWQQGWAQCPERQGWIHPAQRWCFQLLLNCITLWIRNSWFLLFFPP